MMVSPLNEFTVLPISFLLILFSSVTSVPLKIKIEIKDGIDRLRKWNQLLSENLFWQYFNRMALTTVHKTVLPMVDRL